MNKKSKKRSLKIGFFGTIFLVLNAIVATGLLVSYLSPIISPQKNWVIPFFGLMYPYLLLVNGLFIIYWGLRLKVYVFISLIAILAGWSFLGRMVQLSGKGEDLTGARSFSLITYNVQNLSGSNLSIDKENVIRDIFRFLDQKKPDVLCLQEFASGGASPEKLLDSLSGRLGLSHYKYLRYSEGQNRSIRGIVTFSRYPMVHTEPVRKGDGRNFALITDIAILDDTVRLINTHLESIYFKHEDYEFITGLEKNIRDEKVFKSASLRILGKLRIAFSRRTTQTTTLNGILSDSSYPVVVCGDFNDTPYSFTYHELTRNLKDAFTESGRGSGNSYAGRLPSYRIDYIFLDESLRSSNFQTFRVRHSDHLPVGCSIGF